MTLSWEDFFSIEFKKPYMTQLQAFLRLEKKEKKIIFPKNKDIFNAFHFTPLDKVKVVILGQDPYHGPSQANGLCFSVSPGIKIPPSLRNIYKELEDDLNIASPTHGCLRHWAKQGVLLLNSVLTVEIDKAAAHQGKGWEQFTDKVIEVLNSADKPIVFVLWGNYAQQKGGIIDSCRHKIIQSAHPSPLSAYRGFFGSRPFSRINQMLVSLGETPINWLLPTNP